MSYLLIDDGNSRLKWTIASTTGQLSVVKQIPSDSKLETVWDGSEKPGAIFISSVGSEKHKHDLINFFENKWRMSPSFISSPAKGFGVTNAYHQPERLGSDRWAAMIAAYHSTQSAVLVVDAGTALTIDAIDNRGQHLGGLISPGLGLSRTVLASGTNIDFDVADTISPNLFSQTTEQAIASGSHYALSSLIDYAYRQLDEQFSNSASKPTCYLTGGDAEQIKETLQCPYIYEPSLVLKGLALIATEA